MMPVEAPVLILGGVAVEVAAMRAHLDDATESAVEGIGCAVGKVRGVPCVLAETAAGKTNGAMVAALLITHFRPRMVLMVGIAGALNPELLWGDTILVESAVHHDFGSLRSGELARWAAWNPQTKEQHPLFLPCDPDLLEAAVRGTKGLKLPRIESREGHRQPIVRKGTLATGDVFLIDPEGRLKVWEALRADIVDMEGAAVMQVARYLGIPSFIIRSVSDVDDEDETDEEGFWRVLKSAAETAAMVATAFIEAIRSVE